MNYKRLLRFVITVVISFAVILGLELTIGRPATFFIMGAVLLSITLLAWRAVNRNKAVVNKEEGYTVFELIIVLALSTILVVFCLIPFIFFRTDETGATRILESQNYTHVHVTGYRWYGCSDDDHYHTGFKALAPNGTPVTGVVCRGYTKWFGKPSTVRID